VDNQDGLTIGTPILVDKEKSMRGSPCNKLISHYPGEIFANGENNYRFVNNYTPCDAQNIDIKHELFH